MPAKIKVDEDLPVAVARQLRAAGHDVRTVTDQGWSGRDDERVWLGVCKELRLLVTADKGFADIRRVSCGGQVGIILLRLDRERWRGYAELTQKLLSTTKLEELVNAVAVVTTHGVRIRRKPAARP
jgi:predicted nuclease of predicted toxin-antitoxin system